MYFGFKNITVNYGKNTVLEDITMDFQKGKISVIIGENGCGKSTLLKTISKAVAYKKGKIIFDDKEIKQYKSKELAKKIAYLPQYHDIAYDIDVNTLVSYGRYPYLKFGRGILKQDIEIIENALKITGLTKLKHQKVSTLSGGERQRAWLAMAIAQQPEVLVLDEPTTYLDIGYQVEILELIRKLSKEIDLTVVMVLHDINFAARYADYIYVIKNNHIFAKGTPQKIITAQNMKDVFRIICEVKNDDINNCPYFIVNGINDLN